MELRSRYRQVPLVGPLENLLFRTQSSFTIGLATTVPQRRRCQRRALA
jgi:hypothetical protein